MKDSLIPKGRAGRGPVIGLALCCFSVFVLTAAGRIGGDGWRRFLVTRGLVDRGRVDVGLVSEKDASHDFILGPDGRYYSRYGLGQSLMMAPLYLVGKGVAWRAPGPVVPYVAEFVCSGLNQILSATCCVLLFLLLRDMGLRDRTAIVTVLLYAFATFAWQQSKDSFEHPQVTALFVAAALVIRRQREREGVWGPLLIGEAMGLAFLTRVTAVVGGAALFFLLVVSWWGRPRKRLARDAGLVLAGALPFLALFLLYNYVRFGVVLNTGYGPTFDEYGRGPFSTPLLQGLAGLVASPGRSLFLFCPVLVPALFGARAFWRRDRALAATSLLLILGHLLFYARFYVWHGSWCWGPRFLTPTLPFFALSLGAFVEDVRPGIRRLLRHACTGLIVVSVAIQLLSISATPIRAFYEITAAEARGEVVDRFYDLRHTQLLTQARTLAHVTRVTFTRTASAFMVGEGPTDAEAKLAKLYGLNSFDFWWVKLARLGLSKWLILCAAMPWILLAALGGWILVRACKAEGARPARPDAAEGEV